MWKKTSEIIHKRGCSAQKMEGDESGIFLLKCPCYFLGKRIIKGGKRVIKTWQALKTESDIYYIQEGKKCMNSIKNHIAKLIMNIKEKGEKTKKKKLKRDERRDMSHVGISPIFNMAK